MAVAFLLLSLSFWRISSGAQISFNELDVSPYEGSVTQISYNLTADLASEQNFTYRYCSLIAEIEDTSVGEIVSAVGDKLLCKEHDQQTTGNISVRGVSLGLTSMRFYLQEDEAIGETRQKIEISTELTVACKRIPQKIQKYFTYLIQAFLVINTMGFGVKLEKGTMKEVLLKNPKPLALGLFCQMIIMPVVAFGMASILNIDNSQKLALISVGSSPGGGNSNLWAFLLEGDITLSITMTSCSTLLSVGTLPLWLWALGSQFSEENKTELSIPFVNILTTLALIVVPATTGFLLRHFLPKVAKLVGKILRPCTILVSISVGVTGLWMYWYIWSIVTPAVMVASLSLPWLGFIIGVVVSLAFRLSWYRTKTIGIEVGFQNVSITIIMFLTAVEQPYADIGTVIPIINYILTAVPVWIWFIARSVHSCIANKSISKETITEKTEKDLDNGVGKTDLALPHKSTSTVALTDNIYEEVDDLSHITSL